jgi:uncharacterized cupredoxin-like copper-binding protein
MFSASLLALALAGFSTAFGFAAAGTSQKTTIVSVTIGQSSEFHFALSAKTVPLGTVIFKVVNRGKLPHNFKIAGKATPLLAPGKSAVLRVVFTKKGTYVYLCTVTGHAAAGMKGALGVGVSKVTPPPTTTTTSTNQACTNPTSTTITVDEFDFGFTLSANSVACGSVTFQMKNSGQSVHNFAIQGVPNAAGPLLDPGKSATMTVNFTTKGTFTYVCDVPHHVDFGMTGLLTVT